MNCNGDHILWFIWHIYIKQITFSVRVHQWGHILLLYLFIIIYLFIKNIHTTGTITYNHTKNKNGNKKPHQFHRMWIFSSSLHFANACKATQCQGWKSFSFSLVCTNRWQTTVILMSFSDSSAVNPMWMVGAFCLRQGLNSQPEIYSWAKRVLQAHSEKPNSHKKLIMSYFFVTEFIYWIFSCLESVIVGFLHA